jgi:hypothetical protein
MAKKQQTEMQKAETRLINAQASSILLKSWLPYFNHMMWAITFLLGAHLTNLNKQTFYANLVELLRFLVELL